MPMLQPLDILTLKTIYPFFDERPEEVRGHLLSAQEDGIWAISRRRGREFEDKFLLQYVKDGEFQSKPLTDAEGKTLKTFEELNSAIQKEITELSLSTPLTQEMILIEQAALNLSHLDFPKGLIPENTFTKPILQVDPQDIEIIENEKTNEKIVEINATLLDKTDRRIVNRGKLQLNITMFDLKLIADGKFRVSYPFIFANHSEQDTKTVEIANEENSKDFNLIERDPFKKLNLEIIFPPCYQINHLLTKENFFFLSRKDLKELETTVNDAAQTEPGKWDAYNKKWFISSLAENEEDNHSFAVSYFYQGKLFHLLPINYIPSSNEFEYRTEKGILKADDLESLLRQYEASQPHLGMGSVSEAGLGQSTMLPLLAYKNIKTNFECLGSLNFNPKINVQKDKLNINLIPDQGAVQIHFSGYVREVSYLDLELLAKGEQITNQPRTVSLAELKANSQVTSSPEKPQPSVTTKSIFANNNQRKEADQPVMRNDSVPNTQTSYTTFADTVVANQPVKRDNQGSAAPTKSNEKTLYSTFNDTVDEPSVRTNRRPG